MGTMIGAGVGEGDRTMASSGKDRSPCTELSSDLPET
jgi:hypothetical protein